MNRRALLSSLASVPVFAGCSSNPAATQTPTTSTRTSAAESTTTSTTTRSVQRLAVGETATIGEGAARLYHVAAARTIITLENTHFGIVTEPDAQFLVVAMTTQDPVDGHTAARTATQLELDATTYPVSEHRFHPASGGGFNIAYRVPLQLNATSGRINWTTGDDTTIATWALPEDVIQRLNNPPEFRVHSFTAPEEAASFEPCDVEIDVENTGRGAGTFKALLGNSNTTDSDPIQLPLSHGERKTLTVSEQIGGSPGETRTLYLDWGLSTLEHTITITE